MSVGNKAVFWWVSAVAAAVTTGTSSLATAQDQPQYEVLPIYQVFLDAERPFEKGMTLEQRKAIQDVRMKVQGLQMEVDKLLRGSSELSIDDDATKTKIDYWYGQYYFARLTHTEHLSEWPDKRQRFLKSLESTNIPESVHDYVVDFARRMMLAISQGNYHPVARYNAMLLIGMLNKTEADLIREKRLPVPSIQCMGTMLNEFADAKQIDAVRVAVLVGILRHAETDRKLPAVDRRLVGGPGPTRIVDLMVGLANTKDAPQGRSQAGHDWMRRRAIEILGALGNVGENNKVASALAAIVDDDQTPVSLRCSAAEALGQLNYPGNATVNVADIAKKMGAVAAHACLEEIKRVEDQQKREQEERDASGGTVGVAMPSGESTGPFGASSLDSENRPNPLAYRISLTRRRIKYQTSLVKRGLVGEDKKASPKKPPTAKAEPGAEEEIPAKEEKSGILALAKAEDQEYVEKVASHVDAIMRKVDDTSFKDLTSLITEIGTLVDELEKKCDIVVNVDEMEIEAEGLLEDPLGNLGKGLGGIPSAEPPAKPPVAPTAKTPAAPATKTPSKTPAVPPAKKTA
ncbi:MAG: hypothetical protein H8E44_29115, partial [Planctomycetes bacterium]|nr:hypothetical protein [Planctomycetota bacterium]